MSLITAAVSGALLHREPAYAGNIESVFHCEFHTGGCTCSKCTCRHSCDRTPVIRVILRQTFCTDSLNTVPALCLALFNGDLSETRSCIKCHGNPGNSEACCRTDVITYHPGISDSREKVLKIRHINTAFCDSCVVTPCIMHERFSVPRTNVNTSPTPVSPQTQTNPRSHARTCPIGPVILSAL